MEDLNDSISTWGHILGGRWSEVSSSFGSSYLLSTSLPFSTLNKRSNETQVKKILV